MPHTNNLCYEFGRYQLDLSKRVLTSDGETIPLTPKATEILVMLVVNAGQLVEKDELLKQVWPNTFVEEANLTQNIFMLRRALGDDRTGPKYIETVARRGYRFVASVKPVGGAEDRVKDAELASAVATRPVVAVLPFLNTTGDSAVEYLAEGITDNLINNLSRISRLRVMSHSAVGRYKTSDLDPQQVGKDLGAAAVLVGRINSGPAGVVIKMELVETATGWQLWGETFDSDNKDLLQIQEAITRQIPATLKLKLTGDEEKQITTRYTENAEAYQSYLEGRYHWSRYTRSGIEKAITHFRQAIELDPNYALAYAAIVDCYLRLATNYLPPECELPKSTKAVSDTQEVSSQRYLQTNPRVKLRFEWDWKGAERELRRANDLRTGYPAAHQWYFAYRTSKQLYENSGVSIGHENKTTASVTRSTRRELLPPQIGSLELTSDEQLQVLLAIVREQIDVGNYESGCKLLQPWWCFGSRPKPDGLSQQSCADLLFTAGELAGFVASSVGLARGQKHAEELLSGSVALFEQLGLGKRAAEARIALALCYHRQGLLDVGHSTLMPVLNDISEDDRELRSLGLMRLGGLERQAGRVKDALALLIQATEIAELCGPWITARCHLELASIHKDLAISENLSLHFDQANAFYSLALYQFEAVGHHRYTAIVENNMGLLLLNLGSYSDSERRLLRARKLLEALSDNYRVAQANETLARLYIQTKQYERARESIEQALKIFELADGDAILAEGLTTNGVVASRLGRVGDAKKSFEAAYKIAERCGDNEGAGLALLIMFEELGNSLELSERIQIAQVLKRLLATTQQTGVLVRVEKCLDDVNAHAKETDRIN